jgi:hypothetical protein
MTTITINMRKAEIPAVSAQWWCFPFPWYVSLCVQYSLGFKVTVRIFKKNSTFHKHRPEPIRLTPYLYGLDANGFIWKVNTCHNGIYGSGSINKCILYYGTSWRRAVSFHLMPRERDLSANWTGGWKDLKAIWMLWRR